MENSEPPHTVNSLQTYMYHNSPLSQKTHGLFALAQSVARSARNIFSTLCIGVPDTVRVVSFGRLVGDLVADQVYQDISL